MKTLHPRATLFVAVSVLLLAYTLSAADKALYGDAANYWSLASTFGPGGHFSIDGYVDRLRGYSVPLLLYGVQRAALGLGVDAIALFRGMSAIAGAALFALVLPSFLTRALGVRSSLTTAAAFCLLCFVYWRGHLLQPLSDFPALLLLTTGMLGLPWSAGRRWRHGAALFGGGCLALAANARPINEAALFGAVLLVCWHVVSSADRRHAARVAAAFALGVGLTVLPQSLINSRTLGTRNPFAHTEAGSAAPSLYLQQLVWGVAIQRYETNIGPAFPVSVIFADTRGQDVLGLDRRLDPRNVAHEAQAGFGPYLGLVARHPVFFASAYGRHLFNGLDVAYSTPYVTQVVPRSVPFALVNYLVLSIAAVFGAYLFPWASVRDVGSRVAHVAIYLLPSVLGLPTAIECRFLLPLWMLLCGVVVFRLLPGGELTPLVRHRRLLPIVVACVLLLFALASATYAHILDAPVSHQTWGWGLGA